MNQKSPLNKFELIVNAMEKAHASGLTVIHANQLQQWLSFPRSTRQLQRDLRLLVEHHRIRVKGNRGGFYIPNEQRNFLG